MRNRLPHAAIMLLAGVVTSCVIDTVPLPEVGDLDTQALYYADASGGVLLVGVEGATPGAGNVLVSNPRLGTVDTLAAGENGSFAGMIRAALGDTVEVNYERDGIIWSSAQLALRPGTSDAYRAGSDLDASLEAFGDGAGGVPGGGTTSPPAAQAEKDDSGTAVLVFGQLDGFNPGLTVVAANVTRGIATETTPDVDGSFSLSIPASSGDLILVFTTEPGASNGGSVPTELLVP